MMNNSRMFKEIIEDELDRYAHRKGDKEQLIECITSMFPKIKSDLTSQKELIRASIVSILYEDAILSLDYSIFEKLTDVIISFFKSIFSKLGFSKIKYENLVLNEDKAFIIINPSKLSNELV